jgi:hypothetical protein
VTFPRHCLIVLLACFPVAFGQEDNKHLGSIDFFGYKGLDTASVAAAIPVKVGDPFPANHTREEWSALVSSAIAKGAGRVPTDVRFVCCNQSGDHMLFVGLDGASYAPLPYRQAPEGKSRLSPALVDLDDQVGKAIYEAVMAGHGEEDRSNGYSLIKDPTGRTRQLAFRQQVLKEEDAVYRVLASASDASQREIAATAVGYARRSARQIRTLVDASLDVDEGVRNNAVRALGVLVSAFPKLASDIPAQPILALLSSGIWDDRNKASGLLERLTAAKKPGMLHSLRQSPAIDSLIEMARWRSPGHAYFALVILGRMAGIDEAKVQAMIGDNQVEAIIRAASFRAAS